MKPYSTQLLTSNRLTQQADQDRRFEWLDLVRGMAAIFVCASHLRNVMFVDYPRVAEPTRVDLVFYLLTGLGHQSVMVFFVLSGFFVGGALLKRLPQFQWKPYVIARLVRLWTVLLPALALTALVDVFISSQAPAVLAGHYQTTWNSGPTVTQPYSDSFATLVGNVAFLQTICVPVFGINAPLWSLANEFWYYVLFPLCLIVFGVRASVSGRAVALSRIAATCLILLLLFVFPSAIALGYVVWLLGLLPAIVRVRFRRSVVASMIVVGTVMMAAALALAHRPQPESIGWIFPDLLTGAGFCLVCVSLVSMSRIKRGNEAFRRISHGLSEISYSLYLSHFPLVVVIGSLVYGAQKLQPGLGAIVQFFGWLSLLLLASWLFWFCFERRSPNIRRLVTNYFDGRAP